MRYNACDILFVFNHIRVIPVFTNTCYYVFWRIAISVAVKLPLRGLIYMFPEANEILGLLAWASWPWMPFRWILCPFFFFFDWVVFLLLSSKSSLYILDTSPL